MYTGMPNGQTYLQGQNWAQLRQFLEETVRWHCFWQLSDTGLRPSTL